MLDFLSAKCRIPEDLNSVTSIAEDEIPDPQAVGLSHEIRDGIWEAVVRWYGAGVHPALQLCLRRHGEIFLHRAIGHARGNAPDDPPERPAIPCTTATPFNIYSGSKAITAMLIHLLDQRGLLHLDDPVCEYVPEFARHGKQWITLRHMLSHRAGIPNLPAEAMNLDILGDPAAVVELVCDLRPTWRAGRVLAYHAMSSGFILGEVVRRLTGADIRSLLTHAIREPLGLRWMNYGVEEADLPLVAEGAFTGPPPVPPISNMLTSALGVDARTAVRLSNDPRFLRGIVPAGNVVTTADELSRFYQLLLNGGTLDGVRIFDRRTVRRATLEQSYMELDLSLGAPLRYTLGFMLGADYLSLFGTDTRHAFGHLGFTNMLGWADPERQLAGALLSSGKPLLYPEIYLGWQIMQTIASTVPKTPARASGARTRGSSPPKRKAAAKPTSSRRRRSTSA